MNCLAAVVKSLLKRSSSMALSYSSYTANGGTTCSKAMEHTTSTMVLLGFGELLRAVGTAFTVYHCVEVNIYRDDVRWIPHCCARASRPRDAFAQKRTMWTTAICTFRCTRTGAA